MKKTIKYSFYLIFFGLFLYVLTIPANAQDDVRVIITWEAGNFFPSDFRGKSLPTFDTLIRASVVATKNGRFINLSSSDITWHLDGRVLRKSVGLQGINFYSTKQKGDYHFLRVDVRLPELKSASASIPVTEPTVVIDAPYPRNIIPSGPEISLSAIPYFFNTKSIYGLAFSWRVNNRRFQIEGDNRFAITQEMMGGSSLPGTILVRLSIQNKEIPTELSTQTKQLYTNQR